MNRYKARNLASIEVLCIYRVLRYRVVDKDKSGYDVDALYVYLSSK